MSRVVPFDLVFGELADERFPAIRDSLAGAAIDAADRDAFVLDRAVTEFLRELVPEDAPPESLHEFIAVLHHGYLFWSSGRRVISVASTDLPVTVPTARPPGRPTAYLQLPSHLYWGQLEPEAPHEPLDGFFVHAHADGLRALAIFGLHPERPGFTVAEVGGPPPPLAPRADGSASFAPLMDGGAGAGLRSVGGAAELLALAWHAVSTAR
ncbi:MAG TPA: hypothetical protein VFI13_11385 [Gemmatimonadales bacterium]|nr:hypothetical protein [Gemmatimonadales bacterium]